MNPPNQQPSLASDFPPFTHAEWLEFASRSLRGRDISTLSSTTLDNITIDPLYPRAQNVLEAPGQFPYTRASNAKANSVNGWEIRQRYLHPSPVVSNQQILHELNRGVTAVHLSLSHLAQNTPASTSERVAAPHGIEIHTQDDLQTTLNGVHLDLASISFTSGAAFFKVAQMLKAMWSQHNLTDEQCLAAFNADPIGTLALHGALPCNMEDALRELADLAIDVSTHYPNSRSIAVDTSIYHNAGASDAQELAVLLATGKLYLQTMCDRDININNACRQIECHLSTDTDYFVSVAKLRAARRLWAKMTDTCGATGSARSLRICATTSHRMLTLSDAWVNMLRTTVAVSGAAIGGADSISVDAFDAPFDALRGASSELGRRVARNISTILMEESSLHRVIDPMGGSGFIEHLTEQLCTQAWQQFQALEGNGGIINALQDDSIQGLIHKTHSKRLYAIRHCLNPLVGVSEFPLLDETPPQCDAQSVSLALDAQANARANQMSPTTVLQVNALSAHRLSEPFETVRLAVDRYALTCSKRPSVYLAAIGSTADYLPRVQFSRQMFASGGMQTTEPQGTIDELEMLKQFQSAGSPIAIVCVKETTEDKTVAEIVGQLKTAGAKAVFMVGRPPEPESVLTSAGIDYFMYKGCDAVELLEASATILGVTL